MTVRPTFRPPVNGDEGGGTLVLRDGSRMTLHRAVPEDAGRLEEFLADLDSREREEVTSSLGLESDDFDGFLRRLPDAERGEAFFTSHADDPDRVSSFAAYRLRDDHRVAAITLAVRPELRELGAGTLLLRRLAVLASHHGVETLRGVAHADNRPLAELFRRSGFIAEETRRGELVTYELRTDDPALADATDGVGSRVFTMASMRPLFRPRSVAVVGASRDPRSVGHRILDALVRNRFQGPVFPVNPSADHVASIAAASSVADIGHPVDLAVIAVPSSVVPEVVDECAAAGVAALIVISAGFAETGDEGRTRQQELLDQVRNHGIRMVGPNCLGVIHTHPAVRLDASFAPRMPPRGRVALCSQSGALGIAIIALAERLGLGLSSFVSVGNKADVSSNDLLEYWEGDADTDVVLLYLESFGNPRRFARIARRVSRSTPIVAVKSGRTEAGGRAARSHTAALTTSDSTVSALFRQTGVIRAQTLQQMFDIARALVSQPLPTGRRLAVVTNSGGPGILCVDAAEGAGVRVETLGDTTRERLAELLPAEASTRNPVDMIASAGPDEYRRAVEAVLCADEVDMVIVIYTPVGMFDTDEIGEAVLEAVSAARDRGGAGKPVMACIVGGDQQRYVLEGEGEGGERIPVYEFPEEIGRLSGRVADYAGWRATDPGVFPEFDDVDLDRARTTCRTALEQRGPGWLSVDESRAVLEAAGLTIAAGGTAEDADGAVEIADGVGYPVAVKLASLEIAHKTELGGVVLDLEDAAAVRSAVHDIRRRLEEQERADAMAGVLVQPMLGDATEVMIGVDQDPSFGPVIAFGLGGIHVEVLRDVVFRTTPITDREAHDMVREIRGFRLLEGYRGHPAADVAALEDGLLRVSYLVDRVPEIDEIDLNPVFACPPGEGYRVADARIRVD